MASRGGLCTEGGLLLSVRTSLHVLGFLSAPEDEAMPI